MRHKQRGASYLGIFFAIVLAAFAVKLAVALFPPFWDDRIINMAISEALTTLPKEATQRQFKEDLSKRLEMNNIRNLKVDDIVQVTNNNAGLAVNKSYEVRELFFANVELVMTFKQDFNQSSLKTGGK
ncbi:DUF4845 domain-containing protein [Acinetobacter populi]|uniref:DUF4845 domain-containing protein n=1 Tax=Acinetobacter populi TaxID=1582270 RepID=A0A1Z9Z1W3_9GAMM|nr:DUF4845 domain-containing protein [Acinetobacter populi]OUY08429.1 hypothetical protein CAP51_02085 [Acinetobacter populi]